MRCQDPTETLDDILDLPDAQLDSAVRWAENLHTLSLCELVNLSIRVACSLKEATRARIGLHGLESHGLDMVERRLRVMRAAIHGEVQRRDRGEQKGIPA